MSSRTEQRMPRWTWIVLTVIGLACACGGHDSSLGDPSGSSTEAVTSCPAFYLSSYATNSTITNGTYAPSAAFTIPSTILVTSGNARVYGLVLGFTVGLIEPVNYTCSYTASDEVTYSFTSCAGIPTLTAGSNVTGHSFALTLTALPGASNVRVDLALGSVAVTTNPCQTQTCNPAGGVNPPSNVADGTACSTGSPCTASFYGHCLLVQGTSQCQSGTVPATGISQDGCTQTTCDPATGDILTGPVSSPPSYCGASSGVNSLALNSYDPTVPANLYDQSTFIYGAGGPQVSMTATLVKNHVSVIRGQVYQNKNTTDTSLAPLGGVTVTILNHLEYGSSVSRADGAYDLVVNGGGGLTVNFQKSGFISSQRKAQTRWLDYTVIDDTVLLPADTTSTVTFSTSSGLQPFLGKQHGTTNPPTSVDDNDGKRTAVLLIPPGTTIVSPPNLNNTPLTLHITEHTAGMSGKKAMPGELPPNSAYTYAVDMTLDQANGSTVTFANGYGNSVVTYVDNFLNLDFTSYNGGSPDPVPSGAYDRTQGAWVPGPSGQLVKVLTVNGSQTTLSLDGTNPAVDSAFTPSIMPGERAQIATLYTANHTFWRVPLAHFSPWDFNMGFGPPTGAAAPNLPPPNPNARKQGGCQRGGSIIECENQNLAEQLPVSGTPFSLRYQSNRTPGRFITVQIPISGSTLPPGVIRIDTIVRAAGRTPWTFSNPPGLDEYVEWTWDRLDAYKRLRSGHTDVVVGIGYAYNGSTSYLPTGQFGMFGNGTPITANRALREVELWQYYTFPIDEIDAKSAWGLGGWSLSAQHVYDAFGHTLYGGDGSTRLADGSQFTVMRTVAGNGQSTSSGNVWPFGDGGPALSAEVVVNHMAVGSDGAVYIADGTNQVRRIDTSVGSPGVSGYITLIGGNGVQEAANTGDTKDGPATAGPVSPLGMAIGPDNTIYLTTMFTNRVRMIKGGIISTIAGNGQAPVQCTSGPCGDGTPAHGAGSFPLDTPTGVTFGPDGAVYFSEAGNGRVRKIRTDGTLTTVAGTYKGTSGSGDGGPSTAAVLLAPEGVAFGPDGTMYIADEADSRVRKVTPDGIIHTAAGTGDFSYTGDGGPAVSATLESPFDVVVGNDGSLYISDINTFVVRVVDPAGIIRTITNPKAYPNAGSLCFNPYPHLFGDNGPALAASVCAPMGLALASDNTLYIADTGETGSGDLSQRVRSISPALPGFTVLDALIPNEAGTEVYHFNYAGRHQHTYDALRGQTLATFNPSTGPVTQIVDADGNTTSINRGSNPYTITAQFNQATSITLDTFGFASKIQNNNGEAVNLAYYKDSSGNENGLLNTLSDPKSQVHTFKFTPDGLLKEDDDPAGGQSTLVRSVQANGSSVAFATLTTGSNYLTATYANTRLSTGGDQYSSTDPSGVSQTLARTPDGIQTATLYDKNGTAVASGSVPLGPDPRWGMLAPIVGSVAPATGPTTPSTFTMAPSPTSPGPSMQVGQNVLATVTSGLFTLTSQTRTVTVNAQLGANVQQTLKTTYTYGPPTTVQVQTTTGRTATATFDSMDRPIGIATPGLASAAINYNTTACPGEGCNGRVTSIVWTDAQNNHRTWTPKYDYAPDTGFASSVITPTDTFGFPSRDGVGRIKTVQLPVLSNYTQATQNQIIASYDANGNTIAVTPPTALGTPPTHHFNAYTPVDLLGTYDPPPAGLQSYDTNYTYTPDGKPWTAKIPEGSSQVTALVDYEPSGRLWSTFDPMAGSSGVSQEIVYNPASQIQSITPTSGVSTAYTYQGLLLSSVTWSGFTSGSVSWGYIDPNSTANDSFFRKTSQTIGGSTVGIKYDQDGLFAGCTNPIAPTSYSLTRDFGGKNGLLTGSKLGSVTDSWTYNGFAEPMSYSAISGATALYQFTVTARDPGGRIQSMSETNNGATHSWQFTYDGHDQLWTAKRDSGSPTTYLYDPNGNRISGPNAGTYDAQDRYNPTTSCAYTSNGDLTSKTVAGQTTTYSYDLSGNLRSALLSGSHAINYFIDGQNRRAGRQVLLGLGAVLNQGFLYDDQDRVVAELGGLSGATNLVSTFVYGTKPNVPDYMIRGGRIYRIISDWRGSVRLVVDTTVNPATVVQQIDYDEFGNATVNDTTCSGALNCLYFQPFGFAGGIYDKDTQLVRFGARDYDPTIGRWTQKDSLGFEGGTNFYAYAGNDPINYVDPSGRIIWFIVAGAVEGAFQGAAIEFLSQLASNALHGGGCIDWRAVGVAGARGGVYGAVGGIFTGISALGKAASIASGGGGSGGGGGRGSNNLRPDPNAGGAHSTFKTDAHGNVTNYVEWRENPQNPAGFDQVKRVDVTGGSHFDKATGQDIPTPHVHEGRTVRPALPDEVP